MRRQSGAAVANLGPFRFQFNSFASVFKRFLEVSQACIRTRTIRIENVVRWVNRDCLREQINRFSKVSGAERGISFVFQLVALDTCQCNVYHAMCTIAVMSLRFSANKTAMTCNWNVFPKRSAVGCGVAQSLCVSRTRRNVACSAACGLSEDMEFA